MNNVIIGAIALLGAVFALVAVNASKRHEKSVKDLPYPTPEVVELALKGEKVKAIKKYRQQSSVSLQEANRVINTLNDTQ